MFGNNLTKVKNCSEIDALALTYYLYQLCKDINDLESHEEYQILYNALVEKLGLRKHADNVLDMFIEKSVEERTLIPMDVGEKYRHPFSMKSPLSENFRTDEMIFENCGGWKTDNIHNINLVRVLFSGIDVKFSKIIAMTFFLTPEALKKNGSNIPVNIAIPANVKKACENLDTVKFARDTLKLSKDEAKVLQMIYRIMSIKELYDICNDLFRSDELNRFDIYSKCLNMTQRELRLILKNDQKLRAYGLIDSDGDMEDDAVDAINEKDMRFYFTDIIKNEKNMKAYDVKSFSIKQDKTDLTVQLLKNGSGCNILLYGAPGAGKTEYAKALIKQSGLKMTTFKNELEVSSNPEKAISRLNCYLSLKKDDSILVVDEAETILKTSGFFFGSKFSLPQKGTVNKMLENSENKVIWILNYTDELDESTLRRFTYSIKFQEMPKTTLRTIAEKKFNSVHMSKQLKSEILDLCGKYQVTGASVDNIVRAVKSLDCSKENHDQVIKDVQNVLEANSSLLFGKKKMRDKVKDSYNLDILNTSIPANELVEMVENAAAYKDEHAENPEGIRMLFYGLSGTGKTELARYISEKLGKKLLLKRASDIIDKYVGETEKLIKEAFEEAEATDAILLFDEADSFFSDRTSAVNNWERTMVNEFLTQMEEFSGILICTTNLRKIMDPAMQRRFHILTEFKPLNESGIRNLLDSYFGNYKFEDNQIAGLLQSDSVTPGDFGTLKSKLRFIAKDKINSEYIVQELRNIQKEKKMNGFAKIGFAS